MDDEERKRLSDAINQAFASMGKSRRDATGPTKTVRALIAIEITATQEYLTAISYLNEDGTIAVWSDGDKRWREGGIKELISMDTDDHIIWTILKEECTDT
jgi:hypothetical protein